MNAETFLDTNVLLYAASKDPADAAKSVIARGLMRDTDFGVSLQLLQEFYHNARVKARLAIDADLCRQIIEKLLTRPLVLTDLELFDVARGLSERFQVRYWDAALLAAARRLGASQFYSEDLNNGQDYDGVRVINPFPRLAG